MVIHTLWYLKDVRKGIITLASGVSSFRIFQVRFIAFEVDSVSLNYMVTAI